jgi:uncharacterized protein YcbK (DUF882 family)
MLAFGFLILTAPGAKAETRNLKLYHLHTGEKAEIVYKRNGRYDQAGLQKINMLLRDWRRNEPTRMDPRLLDLVWEAYRTSGSHAYIQVVCGYRSPATNSMLRSRSRGVAEKSQHMLGKAMDFYIPDVPLKTLRNIGLRMQGGGVGYYPTSGSPFVHMDVGNVRHWPRMSRQELVQVFPNGKTLHVPSDGKPLPGFEQALASYKARKGSGNLAIASAASPSTSRGRSWLAALFGGGGADEEEDNAGGTAVAEAAAPAPSKAVESAQANSKKPAPGILIVPPEQAKPAEIRPAEAVEEPAGQTPETIIAALPQRDVPVPGEAPRPQVDVGQQAEIVPLQVAAEGGADAAQPTQVAFGIPLPTHRPQYAPPADSASVDDGATTLLAMAEPVASDAGVPMPGARPDQGDDNLIVASLPESRPSLAPLQEPDPAAMDDAYDDAQDEDQVFGIAPSDTVAVPEQSAAKGGRVASVASPRSVLAGRKPGSDPAAAIASGVRTTPKSARAAAKGNRPEPRPVVVAAQPQAARWALDTDVVALNSQATVAPAIAYNIVRTAPREVYTTGFQQVTQVADANRFSGKAVTFFSVARFDVN